MNVILLVVRNIYCFICFLWRKKQYFLLKEFVCFFCFTLVNILMTILVLVLKNNVRRDLLKLNFDWTNEGAVLPFKNYSFIFLVLTKITSVNLRKSLKNNFLGFLFDFSKKVKLQINWYHYILGKKGYHGIFWKKKPKSNKEENFTSIKYHLLI